MMNDCLWYQIGFCIGHFGHPCGSQCKRYLSMNSFEGRLLLENYESDVKKAMEPVKRKWHAVYNSHCKEGK